MLISNWSLVDFILMFILVFILMTAILGSAEWFFFIRVSVYQKK